MVTYILHQCCSTSKVHVVKAIMFQWHGHHHTIYIHFIAFIALAGAAAFMARRFMAAFFIAFMAFAGAAAFMARRFMAAFFMAFMALAGAAAFMAPRFMAAFFIAFMALAAH